MSQSKARRKGTAQKNNSMNWIIGGIVAAAGVVLALVLVNLFAPRPTGNFLVSAGRTLGKADAPLTIDMYADFQCPICLRADLMLRELAPKYIDTGKAKVVFHNFAFIGPESKWAAQAAECANDQGKFWEYATYVFDHQTGENVGAFSQANLKQFAQDLKLDTAAFNSCLDSGKHAALVETELAQGEALGIQATPSFYINGQLTRGLMSAAQLGQIIETAQPKP